jgi:sarcosine oxidase
MNPAMNFQVAVIGGGVMGCAAARAMAARNDRVVLFEAAEVGHRMGSSQGQTRIIRLAYSDPFYVPLCRAAYPAWRRLEEEAGEPLLHISGGLDIAMGTVPSWQATAAAMKAAQVPHEVLDRTGVSRRFPQFRLPDDAVGLFQADAGVLHADRCLAALAASALRSGAVFKEQEAVLSLRPNASGFEIKTGKGRYGADRLVIAAGVGTAAMLGGIGLDLPLTVSKEQVAYFRPRERAHFQAGTFPVFILHLGGKLLSSGFPLIREDGMKLMIENKRVAADDGDAPDLRLLVDLERQVRRILPGLDPEAARVETCRYTLTPDEDFIIDRHPRDPRITLISACSGHGFKFAPLFGDVVADLSAHRTPSIDLGPFRIDRPALKQSLMASEDVSNRRRTS